MLELIRDGEDPASQGPSAVVGESESVGNADKSKARKAYTPSGSSYSTFEDVLLCRAWLATSMDPICGTEQKNTRLWEKIHAHFHHQKEYVQLPSFHLNLNHYVL